VVVPEPEVPELVEGPKDGVVVPEPAKRWWLTWKKYDPCLKKVKTNKKKSQ